MLAKNDMPQFVGSLFLAVFSIFFSSAQAQESVSSRFCMRDLSAIQRQFYQPQNLIPFKNTGGMAHLQIGVCWWHSRFNRAAQYLAQFRPDLAKPTDAEALSLIRDIRYMRQVAVIPGYADLAGFIKDHAETLQSELQAWQAEDNLYRRAWFRGLEGRATFKPDLLKQTMDELYLDFAKGPWPIYLRLRLRPFNHAWLILNISPTSEGYTFDYLDSTYPTDVQHIIYRYGDGVFGTQQLGKEYYSKAEKSLKIIFPYQEESRDFNFILNSLKSYCLREIGTDFPLNRSEIEVPKK